MANFAERLDLALTKRGFTGAQVASALTEAGIPITRAYVSQLRTGKQTNPTLQVLRALASCLQVSVGWLVGDDFLESGSVEDLQLRAATIGLSASGLSESSLAVLRGVVELARKAEGLPEEPSRPPTSRGGRAAERPAAPGARQAVARPAPVGAALGRAGRDRDRQGRGGDPAIEEGRIAPPPITVERLLTVYGVSVPPSASTSSRWPGRARGRLVRRPVGAVWLATGYALEGRATVIRTYHNQFVPRCCRPRSTPGPPSPWPGPRRSGSRRSRRRWRWCWPARRRCRATTAWCCGR
ncbi:helix-turn-helix domain-containing protein [[Actinomadura] parvosata]|uniref:helix-turn-helix domain-containing protein n=1 Tax=[Actinomadura] parvosata TaxID=1955412 RepID=UPI0018AD14C0|nr:helix-turn-helix domain-containing protein [Nonomuraea sp. ATCC 55076]